MREVHVNAVGPLLDRLDAVPEDGLDLALDRVVDGVSEIAPLNGHKAVDQRTTERSPAECASGAAIGADEGDAVIEVADLRRTLGSKSMRSATSIPKPQKSMT